QAVAPPRAALRGGNRRHGSGSGFDAANPTAARTDPWPFGPADLLFARRARRLGTVSSTDQARFDRGAARPGIRPAVRGASRAAARERADVALCGIGGAGWSADAHHLGRLHA